MIYKNFKDKKLSALGMGCMRLPCKGDDSAVDQAAVDAMVKTALDSGINYFDTAWGYHGGNSETAIGEALAKYPRDSFYLASKFPGYDRNNWDKVETIFEEQLRKCKVDHFDFYMFHNVCEMNIDAYLDEKYGIFDYLIEQKKNGRITHLGFSVHGDFPVINRFLDAYGEYMEFCQIELNYFDWTFQNAKEKVELLKSKNIPIWVMEPVRGGQLASLGEADTARLKSARPDESVTAWAFRFLQTIPEVTVTLSGMSDMAQLKENISVYSEEKPLNEDEKKLILDVADGMIRRTSVPCTGCHYCVSHCPKGLDIPMLLKLYNESKAEGAGVFITPMALSALDDSKKPSACIGCRSCEKVCPQQIKISEAMRDF